MWRNLRGSLEGQGALTSLSWGHELETYLGDQKILPDVRQTVGTGTRVST